MKKYAALAVLCLALTGCGPRPPLELTVRKVSVDILLGAEKKVQQVIQSIFPPPRRPSLTIAPVTRPPDVLLPSPLPTIIPLPSPVACPADNPFAFPEKAATTDLTGQPTDGNFLFRNAGSFTPDTGAKTVFAFPAASIHVVSKPTPGTAPGTFTFDVLDSAAGLDGKTRVKTMFLVQPNNPTSGAPGGVTASQAAGIFITRMVTDDGKNPPVTFSPSPPIIYFQAPMSFGTAWDTAGSDGQSSLQLHMAVDDTGSKKSLKGHRVVNACGTPLDSWEVHAVGQFVSSSQSLQLDWVYDVASQLGGATIQAALKQAGTASLTGPPQLSSNVTTISAPKPVGQ